MIDHICSSFKELSVSVLTQNNVFKDSVDYKDLIKAKQLIQDILDFTLEGEYQTFPSLYAQFIYFSNKTKLNHFVYSRINYLLKFNHQKALPNVSFFAEIIISINKIFIMHVADCAFDLPRAFLDLQNNLMIEETLAPNTKILYDFKAEILSIELDKTKYETKLLKIKAKTDISTEIIDIYLWDAQQPLPFEKQFSKLADYYYPGCRVNFFNLKYYQQQNIYIQVSESFFVFMPDYLLDASAIAECYGKQLLPETWLLKLFNDNDYSEPLIKGILVNQILDNMINEVDISIEETVEKELTNNALKILTREGFDSSKIISSIEDCHLDNIVQLVNRYKNQQIITEPSFISAEYGIQGRLDGLIEDSENANYKGIFELKSGKSPHYEVWENHRAQVACYDLILKSVYGKDRSGHSMIFYSAAEKDPLRNVFIKESVIMRIIMLRNHIVSNIFKLGEGELDFIKLLSEKINLFPSYQTAKIKTLIQTVHKASELEQIYFSTFVSYIIRQNFSNKIGNIEDIYEYGFSSLWLVDLEMKERIGTVFSELKFLDKRDSLLYFNVIETKASLNFREGDPVILYGMANKFSNATQTELIKGVFKSYENNLLVFEMRNDFLADDYFNKFDYFVLEKDNTEYMEFSLINSLSFFLKATEYKRYLLFGKIKPCEPNCEIEKTKTKSDLVIEKAMAAEDYFIIQGPPGGKTSKVIMGLVARLLQKDNLPIVILAFTNRAVDEIADRLKQNGFDFIRLGSRHINNKEHISNHIDYKLRDESINHLRNKRVFISTVSTFQNDGTFLMQLIPEGTLIVDEASQLLEPHLVGLCVQFKKWILIGDHYQLPAIASSDRNEAPILLRDEIGLFRLNESLFERMIRLCQLNNWDHAWDI